MSDSEIELHDLKVESSGAECEQHGSENNNSICSVSSSSSTNVRDLCMADLTEEDGRFTLIENVEQGKSIELLEELIIENPISLENDELLRIVRPLRDIIYRKNGKLILAICRIFEASNELDHCIGSYIDLKTAFQFQTSETLLNLIDYPSSFDLGMAIEKCMPSEEVMFAIIRKRGQEILEFEMVFRHGTIFHEIVRNQSQELACFAAKFADKHLWRSYDNRYEGDTPLHCCQKQFLSEIIEIFMQSDDFNPKTLLMKNDLKETLLHSAEHFVNDENIDYWLNMFSQKYWLDCDRNDNFPLMSCLNFVKNFQGHFGNGFLKTNCSENGKTPLEVLALSGTKSAISDVSEFFVKYWLEFFPLLAQNLQAIDFIILHVLAEGCDFRFLLEEEINLYNTFHHLFLHQNCENLERIFKELETDLPKDLWNRTDTSGNTVVHCLMQNLNIESLSSLFQRLTKIDLQVTNNSGQPPYMLCFNKSVLQQFANIIDQSLSNMINLADNNGRSIIFHALMKYQFQFVYDVWNYIDDVTRVDKCRNSLLHAMFINSTDLEIEPKEFIKMCDRLVQHGCEPAAENSEGVNCIHACRMKKENLKKLLKEIATLRSSTESKFVSQFDNTLISSDHLHLVHTLAIHYDVTDLFEELAQACNKDASELAKLQVSDGPYDGAIFLHFALQAGNLKTLRIPIFENYLLELRTENKMNCIDLAIESGQLHTFSHKHRLDKLTKSIFQTDFIRAVDPAKRALQLPELEVAIKEIEMVKKRYPCSPDDFGDCHMYLWLHSDAGMLIRAIETDSKTLLSSLMATMPDYYIREDHFMIEFSKKIEKMGAVQQKFGNAAKILFPMDHKKYHDFWRKLEEDKFNYGLRSPVLAALYFKKWNILPELLVTSQFDIIPLCLQVLLRIKRLLQNSRSHDDGIIDLQQQVTKIAVISLNELCLAADDNELDLLFGYPLANMLANR